MLRLAACRRSVLMQAVKLLLLFTLVPCLAADTLPLLGFSQCLTSVECKEYNYSATHVSHLSLGGPVIAHCVAGMTRSLSRQGVYESMKENVVAALLPTKSDFFFALGKAEVVQTTVFGWMGVFSHFNVVGAAISSEGNQRTRLDQCYAMLTAAEAATGRKYTHILRQRTDLRWLAPVPPAVLQENKTVFLYDIVGLCPRHAVTPEFPCDVPNSAEMRADPFFQVSFERMNEPLTALERHLEWTWWYKNGLKGYIERRSPFDPQRARVLLLDFFVSICFKYDHIVHDHLFYDVPKRDFAPTVTQTCSLEELTGSQWVQLIRAVNDTTSVVSLLDKLDVGGVIGHFFQGSHPPRGFHAQFNNLCACRWRVCGSPDTSPAAQDVKDMLQQMCLRHFLVPFESRQYYYHAPALNPGFDESTFEAQLDVLGPIPSGPMPPAPSAAKLKLAVLVVGQIKTENQHALTVESLRARVLDVYRGAGHTVDVYLCEELTASDAALALVLGRLKPFTVFDVEAANQFEREEKCHIAFLQRHADADYDWFLRVRPDLVFWENAPDLQALDAAFIHARLLSALNVSGLDQGCLSYGWDDPTCNADVCMPGTCSSSCEVYDDQFALIPAALAKAYFESHVTDTRAPPLSEAEECKLTRNGFPEGYFTRSVIRSGGRFKPLSLESRLFMYKGNVPNETRVGVALNC